MSRAVALTPSSRETKWTVIRGAMTGAVRLMTSTSFLMGRSPECEFVVISDPKCSRKHAAIEWTDEGCEIRSLSDDNPVLVNDQPCRRRQLLNDGDLVTVGSTVIQFNNTSLPDESSIRHRQLSLVPHAPAAVPAHPASAATPSRSRSRRSKSKEKKSSKLWFYLILGGILAFFFLGNSSKKKKALQLRTEQQIQADIEAANKLQEAALNSPVRRLDQSITAKQAQENFVRGFRDYRKGQFERSLDSFQACLALDPAHVLCNRYIRLAQRRFNELIQYEIVLGRKYRDQNQFKACRAAFRNVMVMVKDANSAAYKEAKANYDACNALVEGRY
jgi:pSer/pThr/pTyr-binding forkhead associated (FHA) protein